MAEEEINLGDDIPSGNTERSNRINKNIQLKGLDDVDITSLTIHGLPRALESKSWIARIFWMVCFLIGFGFFVKFAHITFTHFLENDIYQKVTLKVAKKLPFPSVTICNMKSVYERTRERHSQYHTVHEGLKHYFNHHRKLYQELHLGSFSHDYDKLLGVNDTQSCFFGDRSKKCEMSMFKNVALVPSCITFNPDGNLIQTQSGRNYGLQMLLYIDSSKYEMEDHLITVNEQDDLAVLIHESDTYPNLAYRPIFIETGTHTKIAIRKNIAKRLPAPSPSQCVNKKEGTKFNLFPGKYDSSLCGDSCHLYSAYTECGEIPDGFRLTIGSTSLAPVNITGVDQKKCLQKHQNDYNVRSEADEVACECPASCSSVEFETMVTASIWPARGRKKEMMRFLGKRLEKEVDETKISQDFAYISVFYDDFFVKTENEVKKYTIFSLLSDLGGQAGLYLGASFFSLIELALVLIFFVLGKVKQFMRRNR